jgi:hypothetical protein
LKDLIKASIAPLVMLKIKQDSGTAVGADLAIDPVLG